MSQEGDVRVLAGGRLAGGDPSVDALVIHDGRIRAIGAWAELKPDVPADAEVVDLAGATILPGLGDAHVHMTATGFLETALDGTDATEVSEILMAVKAATRVTPPGEIVLGLRIEPDELREGRPPSLAELDAVAPDHPVYLRHVTGHASYANSAALAFLDFHPGRNGVELDETTGAPTGRLIGPATQDATHRAYAAYSRRVGYETALRAAADRAARAGCTVVHALDDLDAVRTLLAIEDDLPVRTVAYPQTFDLEAVRALGLRRIGGCHGCALDGDVDMRTAALLEPYEGHPTEYGELYHNDETLTGFVLAAHYAGMQLAFHAVGDRAVEQALRMYEAAQASESRPDARHRIEHAQLASDVQLVRARATGAVLSVQPAFNAVWPHATYESSFGSERAARVDPLASAARAGLPLAGGSDSTVTQLRPLLGVHAAVNHSRPEERLDVPEALALFARGVAYAAHHEDRRGLVAPGFDADLTIVDRDPLAVAPSELASLAVRMTVVRGRTVFAG